MHKNPQNPPTHSFLSLNKNVLHSISPPPSRVMLGIKSDSWLLLCCFLFPGCLPLFPQCPAKGGGGGEAKSWWGGRSLHEKPAAVRGLGSRCACVGQHPPSFPSGAPRSLLMGQRLRRKGLRMGWQPQESGFVHPRGGIIRPPRNPGTNADASSFSQWGRLAPFNLIEGNLQPGQRSCCGVGWSGRARQAGLFVYREAAALPPPPALEVDRPGREACPGACPPPRKHAADFQATNFSSGVLIRECKCKRNIECTGGMTWEARECTLCKLKGSVPNVHLLKGSRVAGLGKASLSRAMENSRPST